MGVGTMGISSMMRRSSTSVPLVLAALVIAHTGKAVFAQEAGGGQLPALLSSSSTRLATVQPASALQESRASQEDSAPGKLRPLPENEFRSTVVAANTSIEGLGTGVTPDDFGFPREVYGLPDGIARGAQYQCVHWAPSLVQHYPLYFEDAMLERHGQQRWGCLQPVVSGSKFFSEIVLLPYMATLRRPMDCKYSLGHYRPGTCAPVLRDQLPWDAKAAAVQGAAVTGFFWGMPL